MPGKGWGHIIKAVDRCIKSNNGEYQKYHIKSLKEKYGSLRMDISPCDGYATALEDLAEEISEVTCESCGNLGIMREVNGWYKVRCDKCLELE